MPLWIFTKPALQYSHRGRRKKSAGWRLWVFIRLALQYRSWRRKYEHGLTLILSSNDILQHRWIIRAGAGKEHIFSGSRSLYLRIYKVALSDPYTKRKTFLFICYIFLTNFGWYFLKNKAGDRNTDLKMSRYSFYSPPFLFFNSASHRGNRRSYSFL